MDSRLEEFMRKDIELYQDNQMRKESEKLSLSLKTHQKCSQCGQEIDDTYFKCLDNFIQTKFFDSEEENMFCSKECFCEYMSLEEINENEC